MSGLKSGTDSASLSTLGATLVPVTIYTVVCLLVFLILRRKCPRVYYPRTFLSTLDPQYAYLLVEE